MALGIGAAGILGVARETTATETYEAPEKYVPILSEDLAVMTSNVYRRPIRGLAEPVGAVAGPQHVEGSITFEALHDVLPYFLYGMRGATVKAGTTDPYTYTFTPDADAGPAETLSFTVERNGVVYGYLACVVGQLELTLQDGILVATASIVGRSEETQSAPSATWPTSVPFGPGEYITEIPTSTQVYDVDTFTFTVNDNAEAIHRLRDDKRTATDVVYGEREISLSVERDFDSRTEHDYLKDATSQAITIKAAIDADTYVQIDMEAAIVDSYAVGLEGQGDLVRGAIEYQGVYSSGDSRALQIVVSTDEDIT